MRVVLDSNVILASLITYGTCHELFDYLLKSNHSVIISKWVITEISEKLKLKFDYPKNQINDVIELLENNCTVIGKVPELKQQICRDPDDDNILALAVVSKADCIITGDKDLLSLKKFEDIRIIRPNEFWSFEKKM